MHDVQQEPIAIIGIGCRFPGADNPGAFWDLLCTGKDAIREVPADRWNIDALYHPDITLPGKMVSRWGGFLEQVDQFDWRAFRLLPREAKYMDPQQRLLLEVTWEALEDAGLPLQEVAGSQTSVSIGIGWSDYLRLQARNWSRLDEYTAMGNANGFAANRLSYLFDLKGPSVSVDNGCTSSLTALYLACQSLWTGEATLALAGGVNLTLSPDGTIMVSRSGLLSSQGRCKTLDANADGFVRGEGAGIVVLKPLSQVKNADRVYALLRAVAVGHNGHNEWIIASNQQAQEALLRAVYHKAGIHPSEVDYVELHGTGFQRGDAIEAKALGAVLGAEPARTRPCLIGSVKTNIGHLEAASGIASVIKVALSLYHRVIPPTLNLETLNPDIPLDGLHLAVPQRCLPWPEKEDVPIAGLTTIAYTGANAHAVLAAHRALTNEASGSPEVCEQQPYRLLPLSARTEQALYAQAKAYREFLLAQSANPTSSWRDICYTASVRRTHHHHRLAVIGRTPQEAADALQVVLQGRMLADEGDKRQDEIPAALEALKMLHTSGHEVDWSSFYQEENCRCVSLPLYCWQRERLWPDWLDVEEISTPPEERSANPQPLKQAEFRRDALDRVRSWEAYNQAGRDQARPYEIPKEQVLTELWAHVLELEDVSPSTSFFEAGGHSLLALQLLARIRDVFQVEIALKDFLEAPTPSACADLLAQKMVSRAVQHDMSSSPSIIEPDLVHRHDPFPTTDMQQAYWVGRHAAFENGKVGNHGYIEVEATDLDLDRFHQALQRLIERHEMLRAVILPDGQQQILEHVPSFDIKIVDLRGQDSQTQAHRLEQLRHTLDHQLLPVEQWPAFELWISRLDDRRVRLHLSVESIFVDAWSMNTLIQEFIRLYHEPELDLPAPALSFRDYVLAEAALHSSAAYQRARTYWLERIAALPPAPDLPLAPRTRREEQARFVHREARLDQASWQQLKARAAHIGLTPSGVLLTAFARVVAAWSKTPRFSLNLSTFNRLPLHPQVNEIVGDFTSLLVLAVDCSASDTFETCARRVQAQLWNDLDHASYSGIQVLRELARTQADNLKAVMPIVFTSLLVEDTASPLPPPWGKAMYCVSQTPQVWLDHQVLETDGTLVFHWQSLDAVFPAGLVDAMFEAYVSLLQKLSMTEEAWQATSHQLIPSGQLAQRTQANATDVPIADGLLQSFFLEQASERPDHLAVISATRTLTYQEVFRGATLLGHQLRKVGACPNRLVAIVMEKGWEQVVGVLGVLLAGAAYLPIDPRLPPERLSFLLEHGEVELAVTQSWIEKTLQWPEQVKRLCVDDLDLTRRDVEPLEALQGADDLAYVIYTSGSTGVPKGVMIDHRGAVNTILDINQRWAVSSVDRVLALSALNFDLSVYDIFGLLAAGGTIVMPAENTARDPRAWLDMLVHERVTLWNSVPALLQMFVEYSESQPEALKHSCLRLALLSGDWIPVSLPDRLRTLLPQVEVVSLGGATEASIWSILYPITTVDPSWRSIPYGRPMRNQRFSVLNEGLEPCPVWVPGQLYISGIGLARGYWRDKEKTQASFFSHPRTGERLYRTGDLGRYLPDGNIEFLGREDFQVKISGYRIELGEIEETLLRHPAIQSAICATVTEPSGGDKRLVAYVVPRPQNNAYSNEQSSLVQPADKELSNGYSLLHLQGLSHAGSAELNGNSMLATTPQNEQLDALQRLALQFGQSSMRHDRDKATIALVHTVDRKARYRQRLSYRQFLPEPLAFEQFSNFLGMLRRIELEGLPKYLYPSAGGMYPVQVYLSIQPSRVEGLAEGIYYYNPQLHQLMLLTEGAHLSRNMHGTVNQPIFDQAAFSLFLIGDLGPISAQYGNAARDFCLLEAGYMSQLLMMTAEKHHIGLCPVGGMDFEQVRDLFALGEEHQLLHSLLGGRIDPGVATGWSFLPTDTQQASPDQPATASAVSSAELRRFLKEKLPEYMVPPAIMILDDLPLTLNGKIDRKNLPVPEIGSSRSVTAYVEPTTTMEQTIAAVWQEVLPTKNVGIHDNFFDLGGNSLRMVQAYTRFRTLVNRDISMVDMFFQYPTIHTLARFLTQEQPASPSLEENPDQSRRRIASSKKAIQQERKARLDHRA